MATLPSLALAVLALVALLGPCGCAAVDHGPNAETVQGAIYSTFVGNPCVTLSDRNGPLGCRS